MLRSHPSSARRVDRWLDRWGRAFVMEVEGRDGSRFLIGLDPNCDGAQMLAITDDGQMVVPDDLSELPPEPSQPARGAARHA